MDKREELDLMNAAKNGDGEAFGKIYDIYAPKLYRFIYYKVHHRETAQDLTADAFAKALQGLSGFDAGKGTVTSWLYAIARNVVIDHYRRSRPTENVEDAWGLASGSDVERDAELSLKLELVRNHIARLNATEREIVIMRVWDEMSHQEIAEALGKTEAACKVSFSRAVRKLRESMPLVMLIMLITNVNQPKI